MRSIPHSTPRIYCLKWDGYAAKKEIGRGGFGVVYAAERKTDGMEVAIKQVSKHNDMGTQ